MVFIFCQYRHRRIADADSPMFQKAPVLPMLDVRCTHRPNINLVLCFLAQLKDYQSSYCITCCRWHNCYSCVYVCVTVELVRKMAECLIEEIVFNDRTTLDDTLVSSCHLASSQISCITGIFRRHIIRMQQVVHGCQLVQMHLNHYQRMAKKVLVHTRSYQRQNPQTVPQTGWFCHNVLFKLQLVKLKLIFFCL